MSLDLSTTYLGLELPHPVVPSASPLTGDVDHIHALVEAGAPAIVLPSLFEEQIEHDAMAVHYSIEMGADGFGEAAGGIAGFWFVASLHMRLTARGPSTAAWAVFGGGVAMVTLLLAGSAISSAALVGSLAADPQVAKTLWVLEEGFSVWIGAPMIVFMLGVSIISIKQEDPPRWLGWSGLVATIVLVVNSVLATASLAILVLIWVLALAVTMTIRPSPKTDANIPVT